MENHHFILKVSRLFPSSLTSCHFRTLPDVAESSITISKSKSSSFFRHKEVLSSFDRKPEKTTKKNSAVAKRGKGYQLLCKASDTEGRKCPSVTPISNRKPKRKPQERKTVDTTLSFINQSSSSNSGWFSSNDEKSRPAGDDETDTFFSLNSTSGDSFRLKTSRRFRKCDEMKSIDEKERCSFSSLTSFDTVLSKCSRRTAKSSAKSVKKKIIGQKFSKHELGYDQISTQIYYSNGSDSTRSSLRRKSSKTRRKTSRTRRRNTRINKPAVIEESYAVEKSSKDPRGDFRASMVEMIVEKQIFGAEDLNRLLQCFLSLNSVSYHGMIVDVFSEICETLFSN